MRKQGTATSPASVGGKGAGRCHPHPADSQENACTAGAKRSRPVSGLTSGARTCLAPSAPSSQSTREKLHVADHARSEEHTSELQSQSNLVCRLLLEKKKKQH